MIVKDFFFQKKNNGFQNYEHFSQCISGGPTSINDLRVNTRLTGRVTSVTPHGAFVDIGSSHDGLLHKSENPSFKELCVGDRIDVECIEVDISNKRILLRLLR